MPTSFLERELDNIHEFLCNNTSTTDAGLDELDFWAVFAAELVDKFVR